MYHGAKHCPKCGTETVARVSTKVAFHEVETGKPAYEGTLECPNRRRKWFDVHYFARILIRGNGSQELTGDTEY